MGTLRIGIVGGGGWLGSAIGDALVRSGLCSGEHLTCSYRSTKPERTDRAWTRDNQDLVGRADVVILSVRPADWRGLALDARGKLVVSVMAGVALDEIQGATGSARLARALPNAAAELGCSYTPFHLRSPDPGDAALVRRIFETCGKVDEVGEETHIDYFTAMSGSGAAFPALLLQAMVSDAMARGIAPAIAVRAAQQVLVGAGRLQEAHGEAPEDTVRAFVDYRGTTAAGILAMREAGFDEAVHAGLEAAYRKARALREA